MSVLFEDSGEKSEMITSETEDEMGRRGEAQNKSTLESRRRNILIGILVLLGLGLCGVTGALFHWINKEQSLTAELQDMTERIFTVEGNAKELEMVNSELRHLLNTTQHNFTHALRGNVQLQQLINATQLNYTLLSDESMLLSLLLNDTLEEKARLEEKCNLVEQENRRLELNLNQSLYTIALISAENEQLRQLLHDERETVRRLGTKNKHQRSILFSKKVSFLWDQCSRTTLRCSRCRPGWTEHASRCFFLSGKMEKWEEARRLCLSMGSDLAVVLNAADQAFLTNLTYQFVKQNPQEIFLSAWIGLEDMVKEGSFLWINGKGIRYPVKYWKPKEPNNAVASWDKSMTGQDCVAIVPPRAIGQKGWLKSWDDVICGGKRHYICETQALILT